MSENIEVYYKDLLRRVVDEGDHPLLRPRRWQVLTTARLSVAR
ncbi:hypothetical protein ACRAWF_11935 [Streptomyces sp. L7]